MDEVIVIGIVTLIVASLLVWFFRTAPFIKAPFSEWGVWGTILIAAIILILKVVMPLLQLLVGAF